MVQGSGFRVRVVKFVASEQKKNSLPRIKVRDEPAAAAASASAARCSAAAARAGAPSSSFCAASSAVLTVSFSLEAWSWRDCTLEATSSLCSAALCEQHAFSQHSFSQQHASVGFEQHSWGRAVSYERHLHHGGPEGDAVLDRVVGLLRSLLLGIGLLERLVVVAHPRRWLKLPPTHQPA